MSNSSTSESSTLQGWKEIANYLAKSVRAVQRWENDFGLPVHRIKTPTGQVVYAFKTEIDGWRVAMRDRPGANLAESPGDSHLAIDEAVALAKSPTPPATAMEQGPERGSKKHIAWMLAGGVVVLVLVAGGSLITKARARPLSPTDYELSVTSLIALTEDQRTVWSHDLGWRPTELMYNRVSRARFAAADLDGDGHQELLAVVRAPAGNGQISNDTIFCFTDTGALKWTYTPDLTLSFDGQAFAGPWRNYAVVASEGSGRQHVWASFGHHTWWPSFIVELDATGRATTRYVQSGAIYGLTYWSTATGTYLAASGVDNEYASASVAVLKVDGPTATSPQHLGTGYHCDSCTPEGPDFFARFPRTELNRIAGVPYNQQAGTSVVGSDLKVNTAEGATGGAVYFLRNDFTFHESSLDDSYWREHRLLESSGGLHHSSANCPDLREIRDTLTWTPKGGWQHTPLTFGAPPR